MPSWIYAIIEKDVELCIYVGSTTDFTIRKYCHKSRSNNENGKFYNMKFYQTINDNGGWDNWSMIEIEKYSCKDKRELEARERYWFELLNADLNSYSPFETEDEKKEKNKEKCSLWYKKNKETTYALWYEKNKDIVNEKRRLKRKQI